MWLSTLITFLGVVQIVVLLIDIPLYIVGGSIEGGLISHLIIYLIAGVFSICAAWTIRHDGAASSATVLQWFAALFGGAFVVVRVFFALNDVSLSGINLLLLWIRVGVSGVQFVLGLIQGLIGILNVHQQIVEYHGFVSRFGPETTKFIKWNDHVERDKKIVRMIKLFPKSAGRQINWLRTLWSLEFVLLWVVLILYLLTYPYRGLIIPLGPPLFSVAHLFLWTIGVCITGDRATRAYPPRLLAPLVTRIATGVFFTAVIGDVCTIVGHVMYMSAYYNTEFDLEFVDMLFRIWTIMWLFIFVYFAVSAFFQGLLALRISTVLLERQAWQREYYETLPVSAGPVPFEKASLTLNETRHLKTTGHRVGGPQKGLRHTE